MNKSGCLPTSRCRDVTFPFPNSIMILILFGRLKASHKPIAVSLAVIEPAISTYQPSTYCFDVSFGISGGQFYAPEDPVSRPLHRPLCGM